MKTVNLQNTLRLGTFIIGSLVVLGVYNSMIINQANFMSDKAPVISFKRLDEIYGKVVIGKRTIAFEAIETEVQNTQAPQVAKKQTQVNVANSNNNTIAEPAIVDDLDLRLTSAFHNGPIQGKVYGSAMTRDGFIEQLNIQLPNGQEISINTLDRMEGNVFKYQDSASGEERSGMFYEVKKGTYMITLINDTDYAGARFEFQAEGNAEVAYSQEENSNVNNEMNAQNENGQVVENDQATQENQELVNPENANVNAINFEF